MCFRNRFVVGLVLWTTVCVQESVKAEIKVDSGTFGGLEARCIGTATTSGRIAAMDVIDRERRMIYVGAASGGVWKSDNGGTTFKPVFEKHTQSIGAIAIDRKNPDVVWVGTGEPWTRNSVSVGTGIYKTADGGEEWEFKGLKDSERISKILIDPTHSDTVYVCAVGHLWNSHEERGVFKTTDGGKSWEKILFVNADTGCGDLAMDPQEPQILYAGMWQHRRKPYFFTSGGPDSGLHKSTDGGKTWRKITNGLPPGDLGRIAIAVTPSRPNRVYATVEADKTGLYRSEDLGESWRWVGTTGNVESRPFYFSLLVADPKDYNRVYKPGSGLSVTTDGGDTFTGIAGSPHPDHHALWINPSDPDEMFLGTDGGVYYSQDRGIRWIFVRTLPVSQFYQVGYDMADPYNVYGGLQDNGTWTAPSRSPSGVQNKHWDNIGFGDGFHAYPDRKDQDIVYVEWQGGRIQRMKKSTGESKDIKPLPPDKDTKLRFNWNSPIHLSPTRDDCLYIGSQFLFRSRDRGETWESLSPDLTTNDPEKQKQGESGGLTVDNSTAENHCTIYCISESPKNENVIWAGTDDGNLQVTRDGGKSWKNTVGTVPGVPKCTWVSSVEASRHAEGTAYATFDGHTFGDMKTHVFKTTDFGETWTSLASDAVEGYAHVIAEDLVRPELLFLGTEFGLFFSIDGGVQWARFENKFPKVAVRDIAIHPRDHDLILATHGRGIWILDDITPLRALTRDVLDSEVAVLPSRPAVMQIPASSQEFGGDDEYFGPNPSGGAQIAYYLKTRHLVGDLKVEIVDATGKVMTTLPGGKRRGINRASWTMRSKPPKVPPASSLVSQPFSFYGPAVAEGSYTLRVTKSGQSFEGKFTVVPDQRAGYTTEDKKLQDETVMKLYDMLGRLTYVVDTLLDAQNQAKERVKKIGEEKPLAAKAKALIDELENFRKTLVATRKGGSLAGEEQYREKLTDLYGAVNGFEGRPTNSHLAYMEVLGNQLTEIESGLESRLGAPLEGANAELKQAGAEPIKRLTKADWDARQQND